MDILIENLSDSRTRCTWVVNTLYTVLNNFLMPILVSQSNKICKSKHFLWVHKSVSTADRGCLGDTGFPMII